MKKLFNSIISTINDLRSTDRGKALLFFGGYALFFAFLIFFINSAGKLNYDSSKYEDGVQYKFSTNLIDAGNYSYDYLLTLDINDFEFEGKRTKYFGKFTFNNESYFVDYTENEYYKFDNVNYVNVNNPNDYSYFFDISNINKLIVNGTYISKTNYDSGKYTYNFEISTSTIAQLKDGVMLDLDDEPNNIIVSTDEDGEVNHIKLEFNSYGKYYNYCTKYFVIDLNYDQFNKISDIKNPIQ